MTQQGNAASGVQRVDAHGHQAGWAPDELVDEVAEMYDIAKNHLHDANFQEAELLLQEALHRFQEVVGEGHIYSLHCSNSLGFCLHEQGRFAEGESICKTTVEGFERSLGRKHEHTVAAMNNYALCLQGNDQVEEAVEVLKKILQVSQEVHGQDNLASASVMSNLAEVLRQHGQLQEAFNMFKSAYSMMARAYGGDCLACASFANNLAVCSRDMDQNDAARYWYGQALTGMMKVYGPGNPKVELIQKNLKELTEDQAPPRQLPVFLQVPLREPDEQFYKSSEKFTYQPMSSFSSQGLADFNKRLVHIQINIKNIGGMGSAMTSVNQFMQ